MSSIDRDDDESFMKRIRWFALMLQRAIAHARLGPDEPLYQIYDGLGRLPEEIDSVHGAWMHYAVGGVTRALEEPTRHMTQATAELIQAGRWLSNRMVMVVAVSVVLGASAGYLVAPRKVEPSSIDASIDAAVSRHCTRPATR